MDARTGVRRWRYDVPAGGPEAGLRFAGSPAVDGRTVYVTWGANVTALDAGSGRVRWQFGMPGDTTASVAAAGPVVHMAVYAGPAVALDAGSGRPRWEVPIGAAGAASGLVGRAVVAAGDAVYVRGEDQRVHALDAATGALRWAQPDRAVDGAAAVVGPALDAADPGVVYCGADNGRLYALDAADGVRRWEYAGPSGWATALVADAGLVYVGGSARLEAVADA
ncbi:hypothetical protein BJF78_35325 [Pseudonocardia sp. CNS-139]|nr:hypothetical protein BJF78_35325 [Pseudonocardia sp. CNS-139]